MRTRPHGDRPRNPLAVLEATAALMAVSAEAPIVTVRGAVLGQLLPALPDRHQLAGALAAATGMRIGKGLLSALRRPSAGSRPPTTARPRR